MDRRLFGRYHDLVLLILGFVLSTVVGGVLTYYFQERSCRHQHGVVLSETERTEATGAFDEISFQMDRCICRMRRIIFGLRQGRTLRRWSLDGTPIARC